MFKKYYNTQTKTLTLPFSFYEELKDLLVDTQILLFEENYNRKEYSKFNRRVEATLPSTPT